MKRIRRNVVVTLLMCVLSIIERTYGYGNTELLRWSCHLESDAQLAQTPGRHGLWPIPGGGGGMAWTVCSANLDEAECTICVQYALKLANFASDLLHMDSDCSGEGVQIYLPSCKMRYVLKDFFSPREVLCCFVITPVDPSRGAAE